MVYTKPETFRVSEKKALNQTRNTFKFQIKGFKPNPQPFRALGIKRMNLNPVWNPFGFQIRSLNQTWKSLKQTRHSFELRDSNRKSFNQTWNPFKVGRIEKWNQKGNGNGSNQTRNPSEFQTKKF